MKNDTKLHRLIRKIVKEELARIHHEPSPFESQREKPPWMMFDEHIHESTQKPFESPHAHDEFQHTHQFEPFSESLRTEEVDLKPLVSKKRRKKRRKS